MSENDKVKHEKRVVALVLKNKRMDKKLWPSLTTN